MKRIAIVGISGSGKSTLANKLGKKLNRPIIHLDKLYWDKDWKEKYATKEEFRRVAEELAKQDSWIIDGNYRSTIDSRLERADTIVFLDLPKWQCLWRVFKRIFNRNQPFDRPEGAKEKIDWALVKFIITYPSHEMRVRIENYKDKKKVFVAKNDKETNTILEMLK